MTRIIAIIVISFFQTISTTTSDTLITGPFTDRDYIPCDVPPSPLWTPNPAYPDRFKKDNIKRIVVIQFLIGTNGSVEEAKVARTCGTTVLDSIALLEARKYQFNPARRFNYRKPIRWWVAMPVTFKDTNLIEEVEPCWVNPSPVWNPQPEYPESAKKAGLEGTVYIFMHLDIDGSVIQARIARPSGKPVLDSAALKAAQYCQFNPFRERINKRPERKWISMAFEFKKDEWAEEQATLKDSVNYDIPPKPLVTIHPKDPVGIIKGDFPKIYIKALVDIDGSVKETRIGKGSKSSMLNGLAISAAKKSKFLPALKNGSPVRAWTIIPITFE